VRIQPNTYACGPTALSNCLYALTGKRYSIKGIGKHAGTTPKDGTTQYGLLQAIERLGFGHSELSAGFGHAYQGLRDWMLGGGVALISTEAADHWESVIASVGQRLLIFDPWPKGRGLRSLSKTQMKDHWSAGGDGRYAILIKR
jgi:hypothetical protein